MIQNNVAKSVDIVLMANGEIIGGQTNATLTRSMVSVDITNKINGTWKESLAGVKNWQLVCNGLYITDNEGLSLLEEIYMNNKDVQVVVNNNGIKYTGNALITSFPLAATYNKAFMYSLTLLGNGALERG